VADLRIGEKESTGSGWRGIWRASVPANAASVCFPSPKRRSRPKPAQIGGRRWKPPVPIVTILFAVMLFVQASALPTHIGLWLMPADSAAMTQGCEKGTCCTALCYLDRDGVHHCVHMSGDSCECGISTDDCTCNPIFLSAIVTFPDTDPLLPDLIPARWTPLAPALFRGREPATPMPPPK
jgi:hypothetical protein